MTVFKLLFVVFAAVSVCFAQTYNISGIVTDTGTTPLSGAVVKLEAAGLTATSGVDGRFILTGTVGIHGKLVHSVVQVPAMALQNGLISFDLREPSVVRVDVYSVQGRLLSTIQRAMGSGRQSLPVPQNGIGVCLYRVKIGGKETFDVRGLMLDGRQNQGTGKTGSGLQVNWVSENKSEALTAAAINDVIGVTKDGLLNYRVVVYNSDTSNIQIKMIASAGTVTDTDGNVYQTVRIGNQIWMAENLRTTKYNDGSAIPLVADSASWYLRSTPAFCYYSNTINANSIMKYGALYNWYAVSPTNPKKIAPTGWHVPSDSEWTIMENYLITSQENEIAKSLAAKTDWYINLFTITGAIGNDLTRNNRSGFSALPGGFRGINGWFGYQSNYGYWWSATEDNESCAWERSLNYGDDYLSRGCYFKGCGYSVRLVKD